MVYKHRTQTLISTFVVQRPVQVCKKNAHVKEIGMERQTY